MSGRITVVNGDITRQQVDAIVNAANTSLLGGGGVDGAIHRAAGPGLLAECRKLGGCETGEAKITGGHNLPARFVIHTPGPVWHGGQHREEQLLASCYSNSLALAAEHGARTVAFPSISTGVFAFPIELAAPIAVGAVRAFLAESDAIDQVTFVCFGEEARRSYADAVGGHRRGLLPTSYCCTSMIRVPSGSAMPAIVGPPGTSRRGMKTLPPISVAFASVAFRSSTWM